MLTIYRCIWRFTGVYDAIHNSREGHEDRTACLSRKNLILMSRLLWSLLRMLLDSQLWHLPSVPYVSPFNYYRVVLFLTDERKKKRRQKIVKTQKKWQMDDGRRWRKTSCGPYFVRFNFRRLFLSSRSQCFLKGCQYPMRLKNIFIGFGKKTPVQISLPPPLKKVSFF